MNTALLQSLKASESVEALLSGQTEIDFRKENRAGISTGQRLLTLVHFLSMKRALSVSWISTVPQAGTASTEQYDFLHIETYQ